jgi:hypothetical protein
MTDPLEEYSLERSPEPEKTLPARRSLGPAVVAGALLVLAALVVGFFLWRRAAPTPVANTAPKAAVNVSEPRQPLGPSVAAVDVPPLAESDAFVRELLRGLSSGPQLATWLATDGLLRNFVTCLDNVASGATPARRVSVLAPVGPFRVVTSGSHLTIDRRSFERYNSLADTVASMDAGALARAYATLKPRLQEAYRELGHPDGDVDGAVEQALGRLLQTPVPPSEMRVVEGGISYRFEDESLESLSAAQKQLLRMGQRNVRLIQRELWAIGRELGIPSERLPAPDARD